MPGRDVLSTAPAALVLGDAQVGKHMLLSRLPHLVFGASKDSASLAIETKYYSATVRVQVAGGGSPLPPAGSEWEAVVLVFDSEKEASFQFVREWAASGDASGAEIKLCIANKADRLLAGTSVKRSQWLDAAAEWCNRELFEYIEVSAADETVDGRLELDGERQGVQRVQAALHAHVWPGLLLRDLAAVADNTPASAPSSSRGTSSALVDEGATGGIAPAADAQRAYRERSEGLNGANGGGEVAEAVGSGHGEHMEGEENESGREDGVAGVRPEEEVEHEMDRFEQMLSQLAGSRGRMQELSDSERRSAAEEMTLRLMAQFDFDEEESDTSDDG